MYSCVSIQKTNEKIGVVFFIGLAGCCWLQILLASNFVDFGLC
jgi:hypothetical protein